MIKKLNIKNKRVKERGLGFLWEDKKFENGVDVVIGVDEVGRGALAGPLVVAAVVFNVNHTTAARGPWTNKVNDSKKLSAGTREELSNFILSQASHVEFICVAPQVVDEKNIHVATLDAMREVIEISSRKILLKHLVKKIHAVVDGKFVPTQTTCPVEAIVGGDSKVFSIAAASIVAKVFRDSYMEKLSERFPEYVWSKNKGYGTSEHINGIRKHGLTKHHRITFCKNFTE